MADRRKEEPQDALKSVFDFIFEQTQQPPEKRKPVKMSNISASSELVDTLTTVLEKPGLYVSDQMAKDLEESLNIQLAEIYLGKASPQGKTKIGTTDLLSIFKDPNAFFDKAYQKSNPKFNMANWSGRAFRGLNAATWAKKQGIEDKDTLWAINRASADFDNPSQRLDMVRDGKKMIRKKGAIAAVKEGCLASGAAGAASFISKYVDSAGSINSASDLEYILRNRAKITDENLISDIKSRFSAQEGSMKGEEGKLVGAFKPSPFQGAKQNTDIYRGILSEYHKERSTILKMSSKKSDIELAKNHEKISKLMDNWRLTDRDNKKYLIDNRKELQNIRQQLKDLRRSGVRTPADKAMLDSLKDQEKKIKSNVSFLQRNRTVDKYYKYKGMWKSMNDIYLHGNLAGAILDGSFFSADNTILNPVNTSYKGVMNFKENGSTIFFNLADKDGVAKRIGETGEYRARRGNLYNDTMTYVSYLTPQKLFQINGEFFAFRTYKNRTKVLKKIIRLSKDQDSIIKQLQGIGFLSGEGELNLDLFTGDPSKVKDAMTKLKELIQNDKKLGKYFKDSEKIMKVLERYERMDKILRGVTGVFSARYRTQEWIKDKIADATFKKWRKKIGERWLRKFADDAIMGPAISQWIKGAGIQALLRGVAEKLLIKLGLKKLGGLVFNAVAGALTGGMSTIVFWGFKIFAQIVVLAIGGIVFFLLSGSSFGNSLATKYGPTSYAAPGEVEQCEGFKPENLVNTGDDIDIDIPVPSNSSCPLGDGALICNQGYADGRGAWSHKYIKSRKPVDIDTTVGTYFYAPQYCDDGGCKIISSVPATSYCTIVGAPYNGEMIKFDDAHGNIFTLVHVKPLASVGEEIKGGVAVAYIYGDGAFTTSGCWGGGHLHLEVTHNGSYVDPLALLKALGCNAPSESQCKF